MTEHDDPIEQIKAQMSQENNRARAVMNGGGQINHIKDCLKAVHKSTQTSDPLQFWQCCSVVMSDMNIS
jgi:hypothetical protein